MLAPCALPLRTCSMAALELPKLGLSFPDTGRLPTRPPALACLPPHLQLREHTAHFLRWSQAQGRRRVSRSDPTLSEPPAAPPCYVQVGLLSSGLQESQRPTNTVQMITSDLGDRVKTQHHSLALTAWTTSSSWLQASIGPTAPACRLLRTDTPVPRFAHGPLT